jgi:2-phospho-L-lactate guanylyltransferase (CobY/MobA/RfbA family)
VADAAARGRWATSRGLNPAIHEARDAAAAADRLLVLPADIPGVTPCAGRPAAARRPAPVRVLAPSGAAARLLSAPRTSSTGVRRNSRRPRLAASSADAAFAEVPGVLGLDVDTPDDLLVAEVEAPEAIGVD